MRMATTQQQPSLGQRIVGSAKGLACSTLSGVSGIEAELRDPLSHLTSGKLLATPQTTGRHINVNQPPRPRTTPRVSEGFRGDFTQDVDLNPDFEAFARRVEPIIVAPRKSVRFEIRPARKAVLVCDFSGHQSDNRDVLHGGSPESVMRRLGWRQPESEQYTTSSSQWPSVNIDRSRRNLGREVTNGPEAIPLIEPALESTWERSQSAAVERLTQFNQQLTEAATTPPVTGTNQQDWVPAHLHWEEIQNQQMRERLRTPERRLQYQRSDANQEDHPMRNFYCRRLSCHRRLVMQEANLDPNCQTRCCVHTGCGYVSQTIAGWVRHCATEHNHLQEIDEPDSINLNPLPGNVGWRDLRPPPKLFH